VVVPRARPLRERVARLVVAADLRERARAVLLRPVTHTVMT
jgi:hypothetical protein